jgi:hypothetical protein
MASNPLTDPNWADATTEQVVKLVDNVKAKTTKPAVMAARGLVFGLIAIFLGVFAVVLLIVGLTRGLQAAIEPLLDQGRAVYISYFIIGGIFTLIGAILFKKRNDASDAV